MSFHEYRVNELFSNGDGTVQFIELAVGDDNGEGFWRGQQISVSQGGDTHTFTFPTDLPSQLTANTKVLIATQGFANLGIVTPDFIVPANFLFSGVGTVNYANVDSLAYTQLPADGVHSLNRDGSIGVASPQDFMGTVGTLEAEAHVLGTSGDDTLRVVPGNTQVDGGGGIDTLVLAGGRAGFDVTGSGTGFVVTDKSGTNGTDDLVNVERLRFDDGTLALDIHGNAGEAYRIYQAAFDRTPDNDGLKYWIANMDQGVSLEQVAGGFLASDEFHALYGLNPSVGDFVTKLYNNVLHRNPDQGGFDYWSNLLAGGTLTNAQVLVGFSESAENQANVIGVIQNGIPLL